MLLVAWLPAMYALVPANGSTLGNAELIKLAWVAGAGLAGTILWGGLLGFRRAWSVAALSAPASTALLMCCYVLVMLLGPSSGGGGASADNDNAAGAGVVFLGVPTLLLMAVLLAVGAGAGSLLGILLGRRSAPAAL
ncbi:hypothetical protein ACFW1A_05695 [Kitasatospora sp. NPDC058965]|uniref:hypothetical protein n=1 Tax=Kitasatospora sp. NPDC058965 TaxID=3346682 RepID=UPI0036831806